MVTFRELKELAAQGAGTVEALAARTGCGTGCGLCIPYIREVLRTGKTEIPLDACAARTEPRRG